MRNLTFTELDNLAGALLLTIQVLLGSSQKNRKCFKQKRMDNQGKKPWFETGETWTSFSVEQQDGEPRSRWGMFKTKFKFHHNGNQTRRVR